MFLLKTELNINKNIKTELKKIYGLNSFLIDKLCKDLGLNSSSILKELKTSHIVYIQNWVTSNNLVINDDLKKLIFDNKKKLIFLKCYRGFRHEEGLPTRGQRTRTNARTQKRFSIFKKKLVLKNITKKSLSKKSNKK
jgi:small subunit ribosomal protein S13